MRRFTIRPLGSSLGAMMSGIDTSKEVYYIDGSYCRFTGMGGWGFVRASDLHTECESGAVPESYSAELEALLLVLRQDFSAAIIYTDSQAISSTYRRRVDLYGEQGSKRIGKLQHKSDKKRWIAIRKLAGGRDITVLWTPGHDGNPLNALADKVAVRARRGLLGFVPKTSSRLRKFGAEVASGGHSSALGVEARTDRSFAADGAATPSPAVVAFDGAASYENEP